MHEARQRSNIHSIKATYEGLPNAVMYAVSTRLESCTVFRRIGVSMLLTDLIPRKKKTRIINMVM